MLVALVVAAVFALAAAPAQAAPAWVDGALEYSWGFSCSSLILNSPRLQQVTAAGAGFLADKADVPRVGEVFYTRLNTAIVGDPCGGGGSVLPEWVPPQGVEVAIDKRHPVYWRYAQQPDTPFHSDGAVHTAGRFGGVQVAAQTADHPEGEPWPLAQGGAALDLRVPLRATRTLQGLGSAAPGCPERRDGQAPCPPELSGDHLQIVVGVADGGDRAAVIPDVGLFVAVASRVVVPAAVTAARLAKGLKVGVTDVGAGTVVDAELRAGARRVAHARLTAGAPGTVTLTLSPACVNGHRLALWVTLRRPERDPVRIRRAIVVRAAAP